MTTFYYTHNEIDIPIEGYLDDLSFPSQSCFASFKALVKRNAFFHLSFASCLLFELIVLIFTVSRTTFTAVMIATTVVTFFSYLLMYLYLRNKQEEDLQKLCDRFMQEAEKPVPSHFEPAKQIFYLAEAAYAFVPLLNNEKSYRISIPPFRFYQSHIVRCILQLYSRAILRFEEMILLALVRRHIEVLPQDPLNVDVHTSLATLYIYIAKLYPQTIESKKNLPRSRSAREILHRQKEKCLSLAIEELRIVDDLSPNNPWIHMQLAFAYHALGQSQEEVKEYEILRSLNGDDTTILFTLGRLYFNLGKNAKGLEIYSSLKSCDTKKADELMAYYHHQKLSV
ncbi:MAG: hypothetical protein A3F09_02105 [Chlamydiae bacterium RIFCSPHIGHO2_12_FULL_49_11]|nr:MAG: hypothetical protein A3F09_02105 [Chlamydiae bacterium RIFCSPHIGHO2_12_FULL_49_11]